MELIINNKTDLIEATYALMMACNMADHDDGNDLPSHYASQDCMYGIYSDALFAMGVDTDKTTENGEIVMQEDAIRDEILSLQGQDKDAATLQAISACYRNLAHLIQTDGRK